MPSSSSVVAQGADRLAATLHGAARQLVDLRSSHAAAGALIAPEARGEAPKVSGRLGRSVKAVAGPGELEVESDLDYAGVIHWGWPRRHIHAQPFLTDTLRRRQPAITAVYAGGVDRILRTVKGA